MSKSLFYIFFLFLFCSCNTKKTEDILSNAENLVEQNPDSALVILDELRSIRTLSEADLARYGWIKGLAHQNKYHSLVDDSLVLFSLSYYKAQKDTSRLSSLYRLASNYYNENNDSENDYRILDEAIEWAKQINDSAAVAYFYELKAIRLLILDISSREGKECFLNSIRYKENHFPYYMLGLWFYGVDSARISMEKSVEIALQNYDTASATHYLRNYAQCLYGWEEYYEAIEKLHQAISLSPNDIISSLVISEIYLQLGKVDSAQYYLEIGKEKRSLLDNPRASLPLENRIAQIQNIIDYRLHGNFKIKPNARYNDSIYSAFLKQDKILQAKLETKYNLEKENMQLIIDQQQSQLWLMFVLIFVLLIAVFIVWYLHNRKQKLLEARESIETLTRLLKEASGSTNGEKDDRFFKKILLQQLGLIRLVAGVPTSANQTLLQQMAQITNKDIPTDSLLSWEDLYPIIDSIYNNFYSNLLENYGEVLNEKEIQLCCLLCAGFSTKEIQVVTQQSIPTIYQRKTTIRKKLGIGEKEDILLFVNQQLSYS